MKHEQNMIRYWFLMVFFIGSMQLIVLSDNFLQLFFGWEGVGLCSYALISFWNNDKKEDYVGTIGKTAWGIPLAYSPSHAGSKAFLMTRVGDVSFLIGILTLYHFPLPSSGDLHFHTPEYYLYGVPIAIIIGLTFLCYFGARFGLETRKRTNALAIIQ